VTYILFVGLTIEYCERSPRQYYGITTHGMGDGPEPRGPRILGNWTAEIEDPFPPLLFFTDADPDLKSRFSAYCPRATMLFPP
jgi:hypothetical protein